MLNSAPRMACASLGSNAVDGGSAIRPINAKPAIERTMAGPDVQSIAPMCSWVVTPPTIDGTRTVVSEIGVSLSPKYAPEITAPAAMTGSAPRIGASATKATPSVAAVVHELPMARPTSPHTIAVAA